MYNLQCYTFVKWRLHNVGVGHVGVGHVGMASSYLKRLEMVQEVLSPLVYIYGHFQIKISSLDNLYKLL